jgi:hypothetical protein
MAHAPRFRAARRHAGLGLWLALACLLPGCAVIAVTGAVVGAAVTVVGTTVELTGKALGAAIDLAVPDSAASEPKP